MDKIERQKLRAARRQKETSGGELDCHARDCAIASMDAEAPRIFATLGTDSIYEQDSKQHGGGRRQFPNQSVMSRIQTDDNTPGSQADGAHSRVVRRQFPKKSACAPIQRAAVQGDLSLGDYTQGKRHVIPEHEEICKDGPMKDILSDVYIGSNPDGVRAGRRASNSRPMQPSQVPFAVDDGSGLAISTSCKDQRDDGPRSPAERIKEHRTHQAPWDHDQDHCMGRDVQRRRGVILQSEFQSNARARALKGLPKHVQGAKHKTKAQSQLGPPSPLTEFMTAQTQK